MNLKEKNKCLDIKKEIETLKQNGWLKDISDLNLKDIEECIKKCTSPNTKDIFNAFKLFKAEETKILIVGQDPYPQKDKAHGVSFSVNNSYTKEHGIDDSLLNIFKAIKVYQDENIKDFNDVKKEDVNWNTNLIKWAKDNKVLLLNTALTYKSKESKSEHQAAWESIIQQILLKLFDINNRQKMAVFLWGKDAQAAFFNSLRKIQKLNSDNTPPYLMRRLILMTSHPSPQGVNDGFREDAPIHFKACDEFLGTNDKGKYIWKDFPQNE